MLRVPFRTSTCQVLQRGFEYEQQVLLDLMAGNYAAPLAIHTSAGIPGATGDFLKALKPHLPWENLDDLDWCLSLQLEGASAVMAAIDVLMQEQMLLSGNTQRKMVAVGGASYHGPPSTSFGSATPLWERNTNSSIRFPWRDSQSIPRSYLVNMRHSSTSCRNDRCAPCRTSVGLLSSCLSMAKGLLKTYISMAQERGIRVLADEIMCDLAGMVTELCSCRRLGI